MASRNIFLPKESNRRIPNGTYGGVRGMNNLYSIGHASGQLREALINSQNRISYEFLSNRPHKSP